MTNEELPACAANAGISGDGGINEGRIFDWENGLPSGDDLSPLSLHLVPPELAFAFSIPPADLKSSLDVHIATQHTISSLTIHYKPPFSSSPLDAFPKPFASGAADGDDSPTVLESEDPKESPRSELSGMLPEVGSEEAADLSTVHGEIPVENKRALKRPRLVWAPQLHKRFVEVVAHLGIKNAVPKTIMQLMNVEGLTRENVASHLQKYRLYLKRIPEFSDEDLSFSDHVLASNPAPQNLPHQQQQQPPNILPVPMPAYTVPAMIPIPFCTIPHQQSNGLVLLSNHQGGTPFHGFDAQNPYWASNGSGNFMFGALVSYPHVSQNDQYK